MAVKKRGERNLSNFSFVSFLVLVLLVSLLLVSCREGALFGKAAQPPEVCDEDENIDEDGDGKINCYDDDCWPSCQGKECSLLNGNGGYVVASTVYEATNPALNIYYGCCPTVDYCYHPNAGEDDPNGDNCLEYDALILNSQFNCGNADDWDVCGPLNQPMGGDEDAPPSSSTFLSDSRKYYCNGIKWTECTDTQTIEEGFLCLNGWWYKCDSPSPPPGWTCTNGQWKGDGEDGISDGDGDGVLDGSDECPSSGSPTTVSSNGCLRGDLDKNNIFTISDVILIIKHLNRMPALVDSSLADVNCDSQVDVRDVTRITDAIVLNWGGITCS